MNLKIKKLVSVGVFSIVVSGGMLVAPANATHQIGHAIVGGIIGGIIGGAINNNRQRNYRQPTYQQPIYSGRAYTTCYWQNQATYDQWGRQRITRVQVCS